MEGEKQKFCLSSFMATVTTIAILVLVLILMFHAAPQNNIQIISSVIMFMLGKFGTVFDYLFGSSSGSAAKSKAIETMVADNNSNEEKQK